MHHIAVERQYGLPERNKVVVEEQSDAEIEGDLVNLRKELYPKPFVVVSHIATYRRGKRYALVRLLEELCRKMDVPFLDPSCLLEAGHSPSDLYEKEPVIAHYTPFGHRLIAKEYRTLVERTLSDRRRDEESNLMCQIYYTSPERVHTHTYHGLGDYLRGCIYLYQFCLQEKAALHVDFSHHRLSEILHCKTYRPLGVAQRQTTYIWVDDPALFRKHRPYVFTNNHPTGAVTDDCRRFVVDHCLTPRCRFATFLTELKQSLKLVDLEYDVIHLRVGDQYLINPSSSSQCASSLKEKMAEQIRTLIKTHSLDRSKTLLIGDCNGLLKELEPLGLIQTHFDRVHTGHFEQTSQQIRETMAEFFLLSRSKRVVQISVYGWGTGFSNLIEILFKIPVIRLPLQ